jgi:hypothetical protein
MWLVEWDHVIEDFSATSSHPSFGHSVLPGCLYARLLGLQTCRLQKSDHLGVVFRIMIEDRVTIRDSFREGLPQLLHNPVGSQYRVTLQCKTAQLRSMFTSSRTSTCVRGMRRTESIVPAKPSWELASTTRSKEESLMPATPCLPGCTRHRDPTSGAGQEGGGER